MVISAIHDKTVTIRLSVGEHKFIKSIRDVSKEDFFVQFQIR